VRLGFAAVEAPTAGYVEALARLSLFADLPHPQLEVLAHSFGERSSPRDSASSARTCPGPASM
jgi:hypothetical protein